jgi:hypothetical protein
MFQRNFPDEWLSDTFGTATFGNGLAAILAGLIASALAAQFGTVPLRTRTLPTLL